MLLLGQLTCVARLSCCAWSPLSLNPTATPRRATAAQPHRYEVKTEGDAFMIAFTSPSDAVLFGAELQTDLVDFPWPQWLLDDPEVQDIVGPVYLTSPAAPPPGELPC